MKLSVPPKQRGSETLAGVLSGKEKAGSIAKKTTGDGMFLISTNLCDAAVFNGGDDAAGIRAIAVAKGLSGFDHIAGSIALSLASDLRPQNHREWKNHKGHSFLPPKPF